MKKEWTKFIDKKGKKIYVGDKVRNVNGEEAIVEVKERFSDGAAIYRGNPPISGLLSGIMEKIK